jgi:hypothetical protein
LGIGPNPQSPIPNPQSPIPNPHLIKSAKNKKAFKINKLILLNIKSQTKNLNESN